MWLAETAVNTRVLEMMADEGIAVLRSWRRTSAGTSGGRWNRGCPWRMDAGF